MKSSLFFLIYLCWLGLILREKERVLPVLVLADSVAGRGGQEGEVCGFFAMRFFLFPSFPVAELMSVSNL